MSFPILFLFHNNSTKNILFDATEEQYVQKTKIFLMYKNKLAVNISPESLCLILNLHYFRVLFPIINISKDIHGKCILHIYYIYIHTYISHIYIHIYIWCFKIPLHQNTFIFQFKPMNVLKYSVRISTISQWAKVRGK